MDTLKATNFIENSFLKSLVSNPDITDVSFNGEKLFYMDNINGRRLSNIKIDNAQAKDFIRQIANLSEKQFSFQNPSLDVSVGKYRINAIHPSVARKRNEEAINFSIRVASNKLRISVESGFLTDELEELIKYMLNAKISIVIGGQTGSGKTEFQKYLLSVMEENTRVVVIDNVLELDNIDLNPSIDLNVWQCDENREYVTMDALIRNALRSNPDWLLVAESRGKEMVDVLNSTLTGHPIITTIHAFDCESMPSRMTRMVMISNHNAVYEDIYHDIAYHIRIYFYLKRYIAKDGTVVRYIESISYLSGNKWHPIYNNFGKSQYFKLDEEIINFLKIKEPSKKFFHAFLGEEL